MAKQNFVSFSEAIKRLWDRRFDFYGTSQRSEYWFGMLFLMMVSSPLYSLKAYSITWAVLNALWVFVMIIPFLSLNVRRFHDIGFSGKWFWIPLLAVFLIFTVIAQIITDGPRMPYYQIESIWAWFMILAGAPMFIFTMVAGILPGKVNGNKYIK